MAKDAIIVESPTKTHTLEGFLGDEYQLLASMGHVRDLPEDDLAVDIEDGFTPTYVTSSGQRKTIGKLKKQLKDADTVYLASDPDREGEAIAWHLIQALGLDGAERIAFSEITETAVREALQHPTDIDMDRVKAQQARRVLDRLVGYLLSPLLWKKISGRRGSDSSLSAGRVQSAALKLVCEREREIAAFEPEEYWTIAAILSSEDKDATFEADVRKKNDEKLDLKNEQQAKAAVGELKKATFTVSDVTRKQRRRNPRPPFITSTLQRAAASRLHFSASKTMYLAQQLYEGVETDDGSVGLITYMRTDSTRIAGRARKEAVAHIKQQYGDNYIGKGARGKKAKGAQEAHEAIRPTSVARTPKKVRKLVSEDQYKLYSLIWRRFIASQMAPVVFDQTRIDITAGAYSLRATGSVIKFPGFYRVLPPKKKKKQEELPEVNEDDKLTLMEVSPEQHFTKPPSRYTEASLVRTLEENGVGRPSTYAHILETLRKRKYVRMEKRRFVATARGMVVNEYLVSNFPNVVDIDFTARVEGQLDNVEEGDQDWRELLEHFYEPFEEQLQTAKNAEPEPLEGEECPECGGRLLVRYSLYGKFAGCENYPDCKYTKDLMGDIIPRQEAKPIGEECPECGEELVLRKGRRGKTFVGCTGYPDCEYTRPTKKQGKKKKKRKAIETDITCDECGENNMVVRFGKRGPFLGCGGFPKCRNTKNLTEEQKANWLPDDDEEGGGDDEGDQ